MSCLSIVSKISMRKHILEHDTACPLLLLDMVVMTFPHRWFPHAAPELKKAFPAYDVRYSALLESYR